MSIESQILSRLKDEQQKFALDALKRPQNRDAFEYGYRVGMIAGYEAAINVLFDILDKEKNSDDNL